MSRLKIADLSFYESEIANSSQVQGGAVGSGATSFKAANFARYSTYWYIGDRFGIVANISANTGGSAVGTTAGTALDGTIYSTSFARTTAL